VGDASGMMVQLFQSNYARASLCVVVPGTGVSMQNRGLWLHNARRPSNQVGGRGKTPLPHRIIPGFAMEETAHRLMAFWQ